MLLELFWILHSSNQYLLCPSLPITRTVVLYMSARLLFPSDWASKIQYNGYHSGNHKVQKPVTVLSANKRGLLLQTRESSYQCGWLILHALSAICNCIELCITSCAVLHSTHASYPSLHQIHSSLNWGYLGIPIVAMFTIRMLECGALNLFSCVASLSWCGGGMNLVGNCHSSANLWFVMRCSI